MADNTHRKNDPYATLFRTTLKFLWNVSWGLTKAVVLTSFDVAKWLGGKTPQARAFLLAIAKKIRRVPPEPVKAMLVRETDSAGNVVRVNLYSDKQGMMTDLGKDFLKDRNLTKGIPDNILETFELTYPEKDLDELRKEIADGDLRKFSDLTMLDGVTEAGKGMLMEETFKYENEIPPFSELTQDHLILYDIFQSGQEHLKLINELNDRAEDGYFSMDQMLDCIEGRAGIDINDFSKVINNHSANFNRFLDSRNAAILLDAIAHHPDIAKIGGFSVDHIASLDIKQVLPVNELVLCLIGETDKDPALAQKALFILNRIKTERTWEAEGREIFEKTFDEGTCVDMIHKYSEAGCNKVIREMMAITYMKTLDERNISQWGKFSQVVSQFNVTPAVKEALQQLDEGILVKEQYNLPLYYGMVERMAEIRQELGGREKWYGGDLFAATEERQQLQEELHKYAGILRDFSHSFEIQNLDVQKIKNVHMALGHGAVLTNTGDIKPEVEKAIRGLVDRHSANLGIIGRFQEILEGTVLQPFCKVPEIEYSFIETENQEEYKNENQQSEVQDRPQTINQLFDERQEESITPNSHFYVSAIKEYGMSNFINSPEFIKSFAAEYVKTYPELSLLDKVDFEKAAATGLFPTEIKITDPEIQKYFMVCSTGAALEYHEKLITSDELLLGLGYDSNTLMDIPLEQKEVTSAKVVECLVDPFRDIITSAQPLSYEQANKDDIPFPEDKEWARFTPDVGETFIPEAEIVSSLRR